MFYSDNLRRAFRSTQIFLQDELLQLGAIVYFLTHLPYNNLHGLSVECVYEWNIGDIIIFDCTQLHSSNDFTSKGSSSPKFALSYFCRVTDD